MKKATARKTVASVPRYRKFFGVTWVVVGISSVAIVFSVAASNTDLLRGYVRVDQKQAETATGSSESTYIRQKLPVSAQSSRVEPEAATSDKADNLVDRYGAAASSPVVADAIKKAEGAVGTESAAWHAGAKAAVDRADAVMHGCWGPGADPMMVIKYGYVPPGMSQVQAAKLYNELPDNMKMPYMRQVRTPKWIARMAIEPIDPSAAYLPEGFTLEGVQAANQQMLSSYMRERFGPIYVPPLHRDPNWLAQHARRTASGFVVDRDNQVSAIPAQYAYDRGGGPNSIREMTDSSGNVVAQYGYDPYGRQTRIGGTGPDADFGYAGYYVHQRSGLNLTQYRAYNPSLGRWLSRDPIQDSSFNLMPQSPESPAMVVPLNKIRHPIYNRPFRNMLFPMLAASQLHPPSPDGNPYVYVLNNPVSWTDPSGLMVLPPPGVPGRNICPATPHEICRALCQFEPTPEDFIRCYRRCMAGYGL